MKLNRPISALHTQDEGRHRFVSGSGLQLVVRAVALAAAAALEARRLRALNGGQLGGVDSGLHESLALSSHLSKALFRNLLKRDAWVNVLRAEI